SCLTLVRSLWIPSTTIEVTGVGYNPEGNASPFFSDQSDRRGIGLKLFYITLQTIFNKKIE
ncbi:MAG TPA: hypothetical protein V6D48_11705, partial [Oculatellaceae cyanobacterium]